MKKGCLVVIICWALLFFGGLLIALLGFAVTVLEICSPILAIAALIWFIKWIIDNNSDRYSPKKQQRPHNGGHRGSGKKKSKKNYDLN